MLHNFLLVDRGNVSSSVVVFSTGFEEITAYMGLLRVHCEPTEL
jgi:hypothetical protein